MLSESVGRLGKGWAVVFGLCLGAAVGWMVRGIHHPVPAKEPAVAPRITVCPAPPIRADDRFIVPFVRVVDGDTIKVNWHGEETSVRMLSLDTPERGCPGYRDAAQHLRKMIGPAKTVQLEFETGRPQRDHIIAGHTRWKAAKKLGMAAVPVIRLTMTESQRKAFAVADNKTAEIADWDVPPVSNPAEQRGQPGPCPVELPYRCLLAYTQPSTRILDPFAGSGTSLIACEKSSRVALEVERIPAYCDMIVKR